MSFLDFLYDTWDWLLDVGEKVGDFFMDVDDLFSTLLDGGNSPITNVWFWAFYICLVVSVWVLPSKVGLPDYKLWEKLMYSVIFFIVDYFIVNKFMD